MADFIWNASNIFDSLSVSASLFASKNIYFPFWLRFRAESFQRSSHCRRRRRRCMSSISGCLNLCAAMLHNTRCSCGCRTNLIIIICIYFEIQTKLRTRAPNTWNCEFLFQVKIFVSSVGVRAAVRLDRATWEVTFALARRLCARDKR